MYQDKIDHEVEKPDVLPPLTLVGEDGNVFAILGRAKQAARGIYSDEDIKQIIKEATSGDYDHALITMMEYFDVE
jgi:hypothetical protein